MTIYDKIKEMSKSELTEFLRKVFDDEGGSIAPIGIGCHDMCSYYGTHHQPTDCIWEECKWIGVDSYEKWLDADWKLIEEELDNE